MGKVDFWSFLHKLKTMLKFVFPPKYFPEFYFYTKKNDCTRKTTCVKYSFHLPNRLRTFDFKIEDTCSHSSTVTLLFVIHYDLLEEGNNAYILQNFIIFLLHEENYLQLNT